MIEMNQETGELGIPSGKHTIKLLNMAQSK